MKKLLALALSCAMCVMLLAGCGSSSSKEETTAAGAEETKAAVETEVAETTTEEETTEAFVNTGFVIYDEYLADKVTIGVSGAGTTMVPWGRAVFGQVEARNIVYQKLCRPDFYDDIQLELAKSIEKIDDLTYEITLWDCIYDSEGNHFTTSDVVYSMDQYIATGNTGAINKFDHYEIVDDYVIRWICNAPFSQGEQVDQMAMANMVTEAAHKASADGMAVSGIVGTGPYKVVSFEPGSELVLEVNEDFWMRNLTEEERSKLWIYCFQNVRTIDYKIIPDATQRAIALQQGTVDAADNIADIDLLAMESDPNIKMEYTLNRPPQAFIFNCSDDSPCNSLELRQAICYAINNEEIIAGIGEQAYPVYAFMPNQNDSPESWRTGEGRSYYEYDEAKAKELIEKSGYNGETLKLMYVSSSSGENLDEIVILVQAQLKKVGINVELVNVEQGSLATDRWDSTMWDFRFDQFGTGDFYANVMRNFTLDAFVDFTGGEYNLNLIKDTKYEELYWDLDENYDDVSKIEALEEYFSDTMCYGYSVCGVYLRVAGSSKVNVAFGDRGTMMVPGAFTFN